MVLKPFYAEVIGRFKVKRVKQLCSEKLLLIVEKLNLSFMICFMIISPINTVSDGYRKEINLFTFSWTSSDIPNIFSLLLLTKCNES